MSKGSKDRTNVVKREKQHVRIFGEKCPVCRTSTKELMSDGQYWCNKCERRFKAL